MSTVSVIVPVYNVRPYLRAALDSLVSQTVRDWTAVCVDDGSTDGSGAILDECAARDARITVVHQPNRGVSAARNAGLDRATGEIVLFMDPDDVAAPEWMARLADGVRDVDLAWGATTTEFEGRIGRDGPQDVGAVYEGDAVRRRVWRAAFGYRLRDLVGLFLPGGLWRHCHREFGNVWSRAFRRATIGDLRFDTNVCLYEDSLFLCAYAMRAKTMRVIGDTGYHYYIRSRGAMMSEARNRLLQRKFDLRDARRRIDPKMTHWRGSYFLSALEVLRLQGPKTAWRYLTGAKTAASETKRR